MTRPREHTDVLGLKSGIVRAVAQTAGLITSSASITACRFAVFLFIPLRSLCQLGLALVVGITVDVVLVLPRLVPCGHWPLNRRRDSRNRLVSVTTPARISLAGMAD